MCFYPHPPKPTNWKSNEHKINNPHRLQDEGGNSKPGKSRRTDRWLFWSRWIHLQIIGPELMKMNHRRRKKFLAVIKLEAENQVKGIKDQTIQQKFEGFQNWINFNLHKCKNSSSSFKSTKAKSKWTIFVLT